MSRPRFERRNRNVFVLVDRRKVPPKTVAYRLGLSYANLRVILWRARRKKSYVT